MKRIDKLLLARKQVSMWESKREEAIRTLVKAEAKLPQLRKMVKRLVDRALTAETKIAPPAEIKETAAAPAAPLQEPLPSIAPKDDGLEIPEFMKRSKLDPKSAELAKEIADKKKEKSRVRIEHMKAKKAGETKRMPLSGKAAIQAIKAIKDETLNLGHLGPLP